MEIINHSLAAFAIAQLTDMNRSLYGSPSFEKKRFEIGEYIRKYMRNFSFSLWNVSYLGDWTLFL